VPPIPIADVIGGSQLGWKTITGWVVFFLGAGLHALGEQGVQTLPGPLVNMVIATGAALAGLGHRHAQAKQLRLSELLLRFAGGKK
jgi:hypothetical protein